MLNGLIYFQDGHTALHLAVRRCQIEVVKYLLAQGCFVDVQDLHGNSAVHIACKDGNLAIVMALCDANCNLGITNKVMPLLINIIVFVVMICFVFEFLKLTLY